MTFEKLDLGLDLPPPKVRTRGRATQRLPAEVVRELTSDDVALRQEEGDARPSPIQRCSARHHALAQLIAAGEKIGVAAAKIGYSASRASILQSDPSFKELVAAYKADRGFQFVDLGAKLAGLSSDALDELSTRLETAPDDFTPAMLKELATLGSDRTGFGPQSSTTTNQNVNVNIASRLGAARKRVQEMKVIEHSQENDDGRDNEPRAD